jgi:methionyl-tRNA formyltransferase
MRVIIVSGTHPRHLSIHRKIIERFDVVGAIVMEREELLPTPPSDSAELDQRNFNRHFAERLDVETSVYGTPTPNDVFGDVSVYGCDKATLNSAAAAEFAESCKADIAIIFGPGIIAAPLFEALPSPKLNMHLGLSPWYKGSATLFWPFFNMEPQWAGVTIHEIVANVDAGGIVHQCVPELLRGDGIHDASARAVLEGGNAMLQILELFQRRGKLNTTTQKAGGRLYLAAHFRPEHLRVIYDLFDNKMIDAYLDGVLQPHPVKLIQPNLADFRAVP